MKAWSWIIQAAKDVYAFAYTEIGTILKVAKDPAGKFSGKRVIALALAADVLLGGWPHTFWSFVFAGFKLTVSVILYLIAECTKT